MARELVSLGFASEDDADKLAQELACKWKQCCFRMLDPIDPSRWGPPCHPDGYWCVDYKHGPIDKYTAAAACSVCHAPAIPTAIPDHSPNSHRPLGG